MQRSTASPVFALAVLASSLLAQAPAHAQDSAPSEPAPAEPAPEPVATDTPAESAPVGPVRLDALPPPPPPEDDLPIPTLTIDRVPPNTSYEFAIQVSYGQVPYFEAEVPLWIGFGMRGGWGKNLGLHRVGVSGTFAAEGDIGVHTVLDLEPALAWDFVSGRGLLLGAGAGPSFVYRQENSTIRAERGFEIGPSAAVRAGWSQTWSRVGRRIFVFLEPKFRYADGQPTTVVALVVGSGGGR